MVKSTSKRFILSCGLALWLGLSGIGNVSAGEETLECKLFMATSMDSVGAHQVSVESAAADLMAVRRASYCVFADGRVADKQFVVINRIEEQGAKGKASGFSIYTMENGDSISTEFTGNWDNSPFNGTYNILGGTGAYANASGSGTITGLKSPWNTSGVLNIVLKVKTP